MASGALGIAIGPGREAAAAVLTADRCEVLRVDAIPWLAGGNPCDPRATVVLALERAGIDPAELAGASVVHAEREAWRGRLASHRLGYPRTLRRFTEETRRIGAGLLRLRTWLAERGMRAPIRSMRATDALACAALARAGMPQALAVAGPIGGDSLSAMLLGAGRRGSLRATFRVPAPHGFETLLQAVARWLSVDPEELAPLASRGTRTFDDHVAPLVDDARVGRDAVDPARFVWDAEGPALPESITELLGGRRSRAGPIHARHRSLAASALGLASEALVRQARRGFPPDSLPTLVLCGSLPRRIAGNPELRDVLPFQDVVVSGVGGPGALALGAALAATPAADRPAAMVAASSAPAPLSPATQGDRLEALSLGVSRFGRRGLLACARVHLESGLPAAWFSAAPSVRGALDPTRCVLIPSTAVTRARSIPGGSREAAAPPVTPRWRDLPVHRLVATEEGSRLQGILPLDGAPVPGRSGEAEDAFHRVDGTASVVAVHPLLDPVLHDLVLAIEESSLEAVGMVPLRRADGRAVATAEEAFHAAKALGVPRLFLLDRILDLVPSRGPFPVEWGSPLG